MVASLEFSIYREDHVICRQSFTTSFPICIPFISFSSLIAVAAAAAKSLQSCPTLCDPIDGSSPGSPIPGILQARTLEWVAISFSNAWKWKVNVKSLSRVWLLVTPWTAAYQAPLSMGFSRQEYWSGFFLNLGRSKETEPGTLFCEFFLKPPMCSGYKSETIMKRTI